MATSKHRNLTVENLTVTGTLSVAEGASPAPEPASPSPVAPHPLPLPEKTTMAALRDRVEFLTWTLIEAGLIHPAPRLTATEVEADKNAAESRATPEAVATGVVDGA